MPYPLITSDVFARLVARLSDLTRAGLSFLILFVSLFLVTSALHANDAGGGAAGVGANVVLTTTSTTATLDNGVIQAVIDKASGKVTSYKLNGTQMVDTANPIYYSMDGGTSYEQPSGCVYSVVSSTTDHIEISCKRTWNSTAGYKHVFDIDLHYVLRRGDTGLYAFAILDHPSTYPAASVGEWRIVWKLPRTSTTFTFERAYVDAARNWEMPSYYDYQQALPTGIAEIVKLTTGVRAGLYDGKYSYSARYSEIGTWGHASNIAKKGVWFVLGGHDYFNDGPTKQDLTTSESYILMHFGRNHYDGSGTSVAAGETWRKLYGPFLLYCNASAAASNAGNALWADAQAQVTAEKAAWPYSWLTTTDHPAASGRGTVTGKLVITDSLKPSVSSANAYIGLAAPEDTDGNWQYQGKKYQYWTRADTSGNFTLPAVRPGAYTLYAYNDGTVGEFSKLAVTVTANTVNNQGTLIWTVPRSGASLAWELGTADRTARDWRHGDDYYTPYLWDVYPAEFPNPLIFNIGTDNPATGLNYVHSAYPTTNNGVTTWGSWNWKLNFNLPAVPSTGNAVLTIGIASSNYARLYLTLNDEANAFTRISPSNDGGNALLRQGIHAKYSVVKVSIPTSRLRVGANAFTLSQNTSETSSHVMYDYLGMELPAFPPPPPSSGRTLTWKGGTTAAANTWDAGTTASFLASSNATAYGTGDAVIFDSSGANTTSITLTGSLESNSVTVNATKDYIFTGTGDLTGQAGLTKSGTAKLTLSSANSYSGQTVINAGTLTFANDAANSTALGSSAVTLNGGTLSMFASSTSVTVTAPWNIDVPSGATATFAPAWRSSLTGKLTGGGTLNYPLVNGSVRAGIFGDWSGFTGRLNATTGTTADFRMALDYSWPGMPSAAVNLGAGVSAYYAGNLNQGLGTFVSFGELSGAASASIKGGAIGGRQITYRIGGINTDATFAGSIGEQTNGFTNLAKTGSGTWTLSGTGLINGTSTVENGTLRVTGSLTHGTAAVVEVAPGGTLQVNGTLTAATAHVAEGANYLGPGTLNAALVLDGQAFCDSGNLTVNGAVTNNGLLRLTSGAALAVSGAFINNGVLDLIDATPSLPANFTNNGLVLTARSPASLVWTGTTGTFWDILQSANWSNGASPDVFRTGDSVTFNDTTAITDIELAGSLSPSSVTITTNGTFTFGGTGVIGGAASLTKNGTGLLSLASAQSLSGPVLVSRGTLQIGLAAAFPNSSGLVVSTGATLDVASVSVGYKVPASQSLSGSGTVNGPLTVLGTLAPGNEGAGTLTITGNLTFDDQSRLEWEPASNSITGADRVTTPSVVITGTVPMNLILNRSSGGVRFTDPFWSSIRTWPVIAAPQSGSFTLGTITTDTAARPASNYGTFSLSQSAAGTSLVWTPRPAVELWRTNYFGTYANLGYAADTFDFDGDGAANLLEYATGTSPAVADNSPVILGTNNGRLTLSYTTIADAKLTYTVEGRDDFTGGTWSTVTTANNPYNTGVAGSVTFIDTTPLSTQPRRFLRLTITLAP